MIKVLFVSTGNLFRSPSAAALFRNLIDEAGLSNLIKTDSAGTQEKMVGISPDIKAQVAVARRGLDISHVTSRKITKEDFSEYDLILAMDWVNLSYLRRLAPKKYHHKIMLLMRFSDAFEEAVIPNPYKSGPEMFIKVLDYLDNACKGVLEVVQKRVTQYQAA